MRVLAACEFSGRVRNEFRKRGHDAWSCDILATESDPAFHVQDDVLKILDRDWDLMIAFPPCTYLSCAGAVHWKNRQAEQARALDFVRALMDAPVPRIAIENPQGRIGTAIRKADQVIHPWQFGDPWRKRTCLWLEGLPLLVPDNIVEPAGQWVSSGSNYRTGLISQNAHASRGSSAARDRSRTFAGIARAMAEQWDSVS